jgi:hypothetical protein
MDRLASCYFCGTADVSLDEYPVVPDELAVDVDSQRTVVLCPSCRGKLEQVLETVVDAVDHSQTTFETGEATDVSETDTALLRDVDADLKRETDAAASDPVESESAFAPLDADDEKTVVEAGSDEPESVATAEESGGTDGDASESGSDGGQVADRSDAESDETDRPFETREYNKVVKLMQNRPFPIDKSEILVVARNAYDIDETTCRAIIDALIDRGVIDEQEGEIVRP